MDYLVQLSRVEEFGFPVFQQLLKPTLKLIFNGTILIEVSNCDLKGRLIDQNHKRYISIAVLGYPTYVGQSIAEATFAHLPLFDISFLFPFSITPLCWKVALPAFGKFSVEHA